MFIKKIFTDDNYYHKVFYVRSIFKLVRPFREIYYSKKINSLGIKTPELVEKSVKFKNFQLIVTLKFKKIENISAFGEKGKKSDKSELENFCRQAFKIMSLLHNNNIRHGDLTARNFMIADNEVSLCDFETTRKVPVKFMAIKESHHFLKYCYKNLGKDKSVMLYKEYLNSLNNNNFCKKLNKNYVFGRLEKKENILLA